MQSYRNWRRLLLPTVSGLLFSCMVNGHARAATVQGAAICSNQNAPAYSAVMTVFRADIGQSSPASVGQDGMFYLYNIPPGVYTLQVWNRSNPSAPALLFQISVFEPLTSLPALRLPC